MVTDDPEPSTLVMDSVYPLKKFGKVGIEGSALDWANNSCRETPRRKKLHAILR